LTIGGAGQDLRIQGATQLGYLLAGDGTSTGSLPPALNGQVLTLDSTAPLGVIWKSEAGTGSVQGVSGGLNIDISGTSNVNPVVNLRNPLTSVLNIANQDITGTDGRLILTPTTAGEPTIYVGLGAVVADGGGVFPITNTTDAINLSGYTGINLTAPTGNIDLSTPSGLVNINGVLNIANNDITGTDGRLILTPTTAGEPTIYVGLGGIIADGGGDFPITNTTNHINLTGYTGINLTAPTGDIDLSTPFGSVNINGSAYPPATPDLSVVLNAGNTANNTITLLDASLPAVQASYAKTGITMSDTSGFPEYTNAITANSVSLLRNDGQNIGITATDVILSDGTSSATMTISALDFSDTTGNNGGSYSLNQTLLSYNSSESQISLLASASPNILISRNNANNTITLTPDDVNLNNGGSFSSATWANIISYTNSGTPTLSQVLSIGNSATNSISLNNLGTASNVISLLPNASSNNPQITLTDGTTTNTIDKNGYTTRNTNANLTHYLNFSDASATGTGAIQKTIGLSCNPSTSTITATTFSGALSGNSTTATTATNATNVALTSDNTSGTYYLPFAKTSGTGNKPLYIDDTTTALTYNPSTSNLTATTFTGSHIGTANITNAVNANTLANPLVLDFGTLTFKNFYNSVNLTSAITVASISFSNAVAGGNYMLYITTGVGGSFTFNTGITNVKTTFATAFTVPASSVAVMNIYYINSIYVVGINILT
jgi:hypothetical protein